MSGSEPQADRLETTITPVRRPSSRPGDAMDFAPGPRRSRALLVVALALLLTAGSFAVFVYLPDRVEQEQARNEAAVEETAPEVSEPAEPSLTREQREALRQQSEDRLAQLLEQRQELEGRSAPSWGAATWESYLAAVDAGADALLADDPAEAATQYQLALDTGEMLFRRSEEIMTNALAAGDAAIAAGNPELARNQFELVLSVDENNQRARRGLGRAENLPAVLDAMRRGDALTLAGDLAAAAAAYREALAVDANWEPARSALQSVTARIAENRFDSLITDGFSALDSERFDRAVEVFNEALTIRPGSDVAQDGLAQAEQGRLLNSLVLAQVRGTAFERREMWEEAMARYREALASDPTLTFAIEGLERAQRRADLEAKLKTLIETPQRLFDDSVLEDAKRVLAEARAVEEPGPMHAAQIARLETLIDLASSPVSVTLVSDNATSVTVYRVGELGAFTTQELKLKPGQYTAIGARRGYRDVRETFTVLPGRDNGPVTVICVEPI